MIRGAAAALFDAPKTANASKQQRQEASKGCRLFLLPISSGTTDSLFPSSEKPVPPGQVLVGSEQRTVATRRKREEKPSGKPSSQSSTLKSLLSLGGPAAVPVPNPGLIILLVSDLLPLPAQFCSTILLRLFLHFTPMTLPFVPPAGGAVLRQFHEHRDESCSPCRSWDAADLEGTFLLLLFNNSVHIRLPTRFPLRRARVIIPTDLAR